MDFSCRSTDGKLVAAVDGRIDESTWEMFAGRLGEAIDQAASAGQAQLIIDLSALDYMSSRGLRVLTMAKRQAEASAITITLAAPNEVMREILAISRYDKLFSITDSVDAAL